MSMCEHSLRELPGPHIILTEAWEAQHLGSPWLMLSLKWSQHYTINRCPPSRAYLGHKQRATTMCSFAGFSATTRLLVGGQFTPWLWTWKMEISSESWNLAEFWPSLGICFSLWLNWFISSYCWGMQVGKHLRLWCTAVHPILLVAAKQNLAFTCPSKGGAAMLASW